MGAWGEPDAAGAVARRIMSAHETRGSGDQLEETSGTLPQGGLEPSEVGQCAVKGGRQAKSSPLPGANGSLEVAKQAA